MECDNLATSLTADLVFAGKFSKYLYMFWDFYYFIKKEKYVRHGCFNRPF